MSQSTLSIVSALQSKQRLSLVKVWDAMFRGAREHVEECGFIGVHNMPEIVGVTGACENIDTLFKVDFFGKQAYLAQSDQLYLELLTPHLGKVYAEIQSFRMEPEADERHLCQFSLFEIEQQGYLEGLMGNIEGIVYGAVIECLETRWPELQALGVTEDWAEYLSTFEIKDMTYTKAVSHLRNHGFPELEWGDDLKANHEAALTDEFGATFITHYPLPIKFFNMRQNEENPLVVNSCDLLLPFAGESAGAAERETEYERIVQRLKSSDMYRRLIELGGKDEDFAWYLNAHKGREVPLHSGAGIGMARVAQFILGAEDIRNAVPFLINSENLL